jgi:hypothetical protein
MSEFEFDRLLEVVAEAVKRTSPEHDMRAAWYLTNLPRAANDNDMAWSLIPFPAGWTASC